MYTYDVYQLSNACSWYLWCLSVLEDLKQVNVPVAVYMLQYDVFCKVLSLDTWRNVLSQEDREHLQVCIRVCVCVRARMRVGRYGYLHVTLVHPCRSFCPTSPNQTTRMQRLKKHCHDFSLRKVFTLVAPYSWHGDSSTPASSLRT